MNCYSELGVLNLVVSGPKINFANEPKLSKDFSFIM